MTSSLPVRVGSDYVVTFTASSTDVHSVMLDGVSWYQDYLAGRLSCTATGCSFWRRYAAQSPGPRTHTVTATRANGTPYPPLTIRVDVGGLPEMP